MCFSLEIYKKMQKIQIVKLLRVPSMKSGSMPLDM